MFNLQAAISTVFFMGMLMCIYIGAMFLMHHKWTPARWFGAILMTLALAGIVSHIVALIVGA